VGGFSPNQESKTPSATGVSEGMSLSGVSGSPTGGFNMRNNTDNTNLNTFNTIKIRAAVHDFLLNTLESQLTDEFIKRHPSLPEQVKILKNTSEFEQELSKQLNETALQLNTGLRGGRNVGFSSPIAPRIQKTDGYQPTTIQMNGPLRDRGFTYQSICFMPKYKGTSQEQLRLANLGVISNNDIGVASNLFSGRQGSGFGSNASNNAFGSPASGGFGSNASNNSFGSPASGGFGSNASNNAFGSPASGGFGSNASNNAFGSPASGGFGSNASNNAFGSPASGGFGSNASNNAFGSPASGGGFGSNAKQGEDTLS
jgi:hypothetical protein